MRAALDWGYQFLSRRRESALHAMSVFVGGCELPAFAAVCLDDDDPPGVDVLDELVRTSFVTVDFTCEPTRYRLLEPVRQYAGELLDAAGDSDDRRQRHLLFYLDVARAQTDDEHQPDHRLPVQQLQRELGNFRVALDWAAAAPERTEAGLWLAFHLQYLWISGPHHAEGVGRLAGLLRTRHRVARGPIGGSTRCVDHRDAPRRRRSTPSLRRTGSRSGHRRRRPGARSPGSPGPLQDLLGTRRHSCSSPPARSRHEDPRRPPRSGPARLLPGHADRDRLDDRRSRRRRR